MSASEHLHPTQFVSAPVSGKQVAEHVRGAGTGRGYYKNLTYHLHPNYPLDRIEVDPTTANDFRSPRHLALPQQTTEGTTDPIVVSDARRAPSAQLKDGFHRVAVAKAMGVTHLPAYVHNLDEDV